MASESDDDATVHDGLPPGPFDGWLNVENGTRLTRITISLEPLTPQGLQGLLRTSDDGRPVPPFLPVWHLDANESGDLEDLQQAMDDNPNHGIIPRASTFCHPPTNTGVSSVGRLARRARDRLRRLLRPRSRTRRRGNTASRSSQSDATSRIDGDDTRTFVETDPGDNNRDGDNDSRRRSQTPDSISPSPMASSSPVASGASIHHSAADSATHLRPSGRVDSTQSPPMWRSCLDCIM